MEEKQNKILAYPLSYAQRRIWFLSQMELGSLSYNIGLLIEIFEEVDIEKMQAVFSQLVKKHEGLRTNFISTENGEPVQVLNKNNKINRLVYFDLTNVENKERKRKEIIKENSNFNFNLAEDSLIRICLIKLAENKYQFLVVMHHIISDIWSLAIFGNEFLLLYSQKMKIKGRHGFKLSPLSMQYKEYATWEQSEEFKKKIIRAEKYWLTKLSGTLPVLDLPCDRSRTLQQSYETKSETLKFNKELITAVNKFCNEKNVTTYIFLLAVFKLLLSRLSAQKDLIVGTYAANRDLPELDGVLGCFLNNLAIRTNIDWQDKFSIFLENVKEEVLSAMDNKEYPFELLIEKINPVRDMSRAPIFNTVFQMFSNDDRLKLNFFGNTGAKDFVFDNGMSQFDLTLKIFAGDNRMTLVLAYNSWLFKKTSANRFLGYFEKIVKEILQDADKQISEIDFLSSAEKKFLLKVSSGEKKILPANDFFHLFSEQANSSGKKTALVLRDKKISYSDFRNQVNLAATYFINQGVNKGDVVVLSLPRNQELIISLWALFEMGAVVLPVNPKQPDNRLSFILKDSGAKFILSDNKKEKIKGIKFLPVGEKVWNKVKLKKINLKLPGESLAYIMYTSGSTGQPKGVKISRGALSNFVIAIKSALSWQSGQRILATTSLNFDIFFLENVASFCSGLSVYLADDEVYQDPNLIKKMIVQNDIEIIQFTPSFLSVLILGKKDWRSRIKLLLVGGESLDSQLLKALSKGSGAKIFNLYGPTETTVWSSATQLKQNNRVMIAKPLLNTQIYILDETMKLLPCNSTGEIYISGAGLAQGYLNEEQTKKYFLANPFCLSEKIYRTGDLGRRNEKGEIEFLGRADEQIKFNGQRVELGEIEKSILNNASVRQCAVVSRKDDKGNFRFLAYYTSDRGLDHDLLRKELTHFLPENIIPSVFIRLEKMPLNQSGKLDKKALPIQDLNLSIKKYFQAPKNDTEKRIIDIWQKVLMTEKICRNDNFFMIGGHSLQLMKVYDKLLDEYSGKINIANLFLYPTPESLAEYLSGGEKAKIIKKINYQKRAENLIEKVRRGDLNVSAAAEAFAKL